MIDSIKQLMENDFVNDQTRQTITEEWDKKIKEVREEVKIELREEFAKRFDHDKKTIAEAMDRMITDGIETEIVEFANERKSMLASIERSKQKMRESATKFNSFMISKLTEELSELRKDRKKQNNSMLQFEEFITSSLANEIADFAKDRQAVAETRQRLIKETNDTLRQWKHRFIKENAAKIRNKIEYQLDAEIKEYNTKKCELVAVKNKLIKESSRTLLALKTNFVNENRQKLKASITEHLNKEIGNLRADIKEAKQNKLGRSMFEAYSSEFGKVYFDRDAELQKLQLDLEAKDRDIAEAIQIGNKYKQLAESKTRQVQNIRESNEREALLEELLTPLNTDKQSAMRNLLEGVSAGKLQSAFDKYLPVILSDNRKSPSQLNEDGGLEMRTAVTGDKQTAKVVTEDRDKVIDLMRLAGIKS